ncbi:1-deoxy-D-xylulose-5-phosphate reductoisomerase [Actinomyces wuliandei]|uniref:1-deoxy-D-xylulose-5-phosphate reductoisomerase n=1 Tax=Actinomyces wuliandei TaxID=2057743 RepID=UPI000FD98162|nr:1-deoxy-D-xylulose-5-phosphate reductoisomerase [Actinomyces wuliandei]
MTEPSRLVLLGSTGSIGTQALQVLTRLGDRAPQVAALAAGGSRLDLLAEQAVAWQVPVLAVACQGGEQDAVREHLRQALSRAAACSAVPNPVTTVLTGPQATVDVVEAAAPARNDTVLNAVTGSVGLLPTLAALRSGARLALANKESLVVGGALVRDALRRPGQVVPVDSEHSAIAQCLLSARHEKGLTSPLVTGRSEVRRLVLTASGGPFRGRRREELVGVTAAQALDHPTWSMGPVVTVNSSTMVNKGLELIEAHLLFDVDPGDIDVVVHPQSVVHSMVELLDGATIAQASPPDMRLPIALGLTWPDREDLSGLVEPTRWEDPVAWTFEPLDSQTFPAVDLARQAVSASDTHPAVLNAANEQVVEAFLVGGLEWLDVTSIDAAVLAEHEGLSSPGLDELLEVESWARARAQEMVEARSGHVGGDA